MVLVPLSVALINQNAMIASMIGEQCSRLEIQYNWGVAVREITAYGRLLTQVRNAIAHDDDGIVLIILYRAGI